MTNNQVKRSKASKEVATSTLTTNGRITIPKEIREHLKLRAGHQLEFQIAANGPVVMRPRNRDIRELKGILRPKRPKPVSVEQMNEAIAERLWKAVRGLDNWLLDDPRQTRAAERSIEDPPASLRRVRQIIPLRSAMLHNLRDVALQQKTAGSQIPRGGFDLLQILRAARIALLD